MPKIEVDSDLNNRELEVSYFFNKNKLFLRKILVWFLSGLIALNLAYVGWGLLKLYVFEYNSHVRLLLELPLDYVNYSGLKRANSPRPISVINTSVISATTSFDLFAKVSNPNPNWFTSFDYRFTGQGYQSQARSAFLLPGEEKFLMDLNAGASTGTTASVIAPRQPVLEITNLNWKRMANAEAFRQARLNFKVSDVSFVPPALSQLTGRQAISQTKFGLTNLSVYNFWKVPVQIILYSGPRVAGVNYVILEQIGSGATVPVEVNWFSPVSAITHSEVYVDLNIYDQSIYKDFEPSVRKEYR